MKFYGLIGKPLSHSHSKKYFTEKFARENFPAAYMLFPLDRIEQLPDLIRKHHNLIGLNVTIPFKTAVIPYLDKIDHEAETVGAVNTICIRYQKGKAELIGYNTDIIGFASTIEPLLDYKTSYKALILGTGGASKAVQYILQKFDIPYRIVSRKPEDSTYFDYKSLTEDIIKEHQMLINATPVGMFPNAGVAPQIPYGGLSADHILVDLIYNPSETLFLAHGRNAGSTVVNGMQMFVHQAEESWNLWNQM